MAYRLVDFFRYDCNQANYLINYSNNFRYIYVETPKVACGTIKRTLQNLEVGGDKSRIPDDVHNRTDSPLLKPLDDENDFIKALISPEYLTFTFVRNPYTRALSCYLDKIVGQEWERRQRLPLLGFAPTDEVSFSQFLYRVSEQNERNMDIHWAPLSYLMGYDRVKYDYIGRFEYFADDFAKVLNAIQENSRLEHIEIISARPHATGASKKLQQYYANVENQRLVEAIYVDDFRNFGYGYSFQCI